MKYLSFWLIFFVSSSVSLTAQHMDMQWYVLQEHGLDGSQTVGSNAINPDSFTNRHEIWKNRLDSDFSIHGIYPPALNLDSRAGDDLFVIYSNGEYFNSRYAPEVWKNSPALDETVSMSFASPDNKRLSYMYFSNKYDVDDLPEKVQVNGDITSQLNGLKVSDFQADQRLIYNRYNNADNDDRFEIENQHMQSSHDVIPRKDVTLVIYTKHMSGEYKLSYNKIIHDKDVLNSNWSSADTISNILQPSRVFESENFIIPEVLYSVSNNGETSFKISNQSVHNHLFVNLRATEILEKYLPTDHDSFHVMYELHDQSGRLVARHVDPNRPTHDPNEIVLADVCDSCLTAYYRGYFHNETPNPVNGLAFAFNFPPEIDGSTYKIVELKVNGNPTTATKDSVNNNRLFVKLSDSLAIRSSRTSANTSFGKVEFAICVKFKDEVTQDTIKRGSFLTSKGLTYFNHGFTNLEKTYILNSRDGTQMYNGDSFDRRGNINCSVCAHLCDVKPTKCKWYNCRNFWFEDFRWIYALLGMGLLASVLYYRLQKDKQRIR